jgi:hypothetical protein
MPLSDFGDADVLAEATKRLGLPYPTLLHYYLPLVKPSDIAERGIDKTPIFDPNIVFNLETIGEFARNVGANYDATLPSYPEILNTGLGLGYGSIEVYLYTAIIRAYKPKLIVEIGAGISTWCARRATKETDCRIVCIEPYPLPAFETWCVQEGVTLLKAPLQEVAENLPVDDHMIMFIDSTHVAKVDSELHHIFIKVLPRVPYGSLVHFHDIFLPYPTVHSDHNLFAGWVNYYETVLLGIYLCASPDYEVVFPQYWLPQGAPEIIGNALPIWKETGAEGSSFWMRKRKK